MSPTGDTDGVTMGRSAQVIASGLVAARFLPIWLAMGALLVVAALFAPSTLENTSWSYILPFGTILAIAALGQMLVVMQAGIDLSTAGVISLCANVLVGVSVGSNHGLAVGMLVCVGLGALVGLVNGVLVGIVRLNPLIVTLAVGQIVLAYSSKYGRENTVSLVVPESLSSWAAKKPLGISTVFWTGAAIAIAVALALRYTTAGRRFQAVGANPRAAWMAGLRVRTHVVFAYTAAGVLYAVAAILLAGVRISIDSGFGAAVSPRADRRGCPRGRCALGWTGERDVDLDRGTRAHVPHGDAAHLRTLGGVAVHRVRRSNHRRDAGFGGPGSVSSRPPPSYDRSIGWHSPQSGRKHELRQAHERRHDGGSEGVRGVPETPVGRGRASASRARSRARARLRE